MSPDVSGVAKVYERWDENIRMDTGMKNWETIWPVGLLMGVVILAILDALARAASLGKR